LSKDQLGALGSGGVKQTEIKSRETGRKLAKLMKKAIDDCELTNSEYDQITAQVDQDAVVDNEERRLLRQLQEMIANEQSREFPEAGPLYDALGARLHS